MSFFYISLEQLEDEKRESMKAQAIAVRGSKLEKFDEFLKSLDRKKKESKEVDHKSNLAMLNQKL